MDWLVPRAAYIHIPFCAHHCGYCDFAVSTDQTLHELYLDAIEIEMRGEPVNVDTIFLGGGTPTHLDADQLARLMSMFRRRFPGPLDEFSIEATPDSLDAEKLAVLKTAGLTRVSLGVQSFQSATLQSLDRVHGTEQIHRALSLIKTAGLHFSLDLIFAAPEQTLDDWQSDLAAAIALNPDHLSTYGLTYEKGTPLWKSRERGQVKSASEDLELAMYEHAIDALTSTCYEHYEISNFARPGKRCRHNEIYWANHAYYGFGVGAAAYVNGERTVNIRDTNQYIRYVLAGESPIHSRETLPPCERAFETIAVQLRRTDGINRTQFQSQTGFDLMGFAGPAIDPLISQGLLQNDGEAVRFTRRGQRLADAVIESILRLQ